VRVAAITGEGHDGYQWPVQHLDTFELQITTHHNMTIKAHHLQQDTGPC
jgi:hypothetical protein